MQYQRKRVGGVRSIADPLPVYPVTRGKASALYTPFLTVAKALIMRKVVKSVTPFFYQTSWYYKQNGKRHRIQSGTDAEKAAYKSGTKLKPTADIVALANQMAAEVTSVDDVPKGKGGSLTVETLCHLYLTDLEAGDNLDPDTFRLYTITLKQLCKKTGDMKIDDVRPSTIRQVKQSYANLWRKPNTVRYKITTIKQVFNWAVSEKLIAENPITSVELPTYTKRDYLINKDEIAAILEHANPAYRRFFIALLETGRRPEDIAGATPRDIGETGRGMTLQVIGKTFKKTGRKDTVFLPTRIADMVRARLKEIDAIGLGNNAPLFPKLDGKAYTRRMWVKAMATARKRGNLHPEICTYSARHYFITNALIKGVPAATVAKMVGNSVATIIKYYEHLEQASANMYFQHAETAASGVQL